MSLPLAPLKFEREKEENSRHYPLVQNLSPEHISCTRKVLDLLPHNINASII
jgi:hypothetical protein